MSEASLSKRTILEEISIKNLGVIDSASVELKPGLNVITGETGAGKTMVITALSMVLGGKTDTDLIRKGKDRLSVSGRFLLPDKLEPDLREFIASQEISIEESAILMTRHVSTEGKSRAQISGVAQTASSLAALAEYLIEIHGQHGTLLLSKPARQRELLDRFGGTDLEGLLELYKEVHEKLIESRNQLREFKRALGDREREIAQLEELVTEVSRINPRENELAEISQDINRLENVEGIRQAVSAALGAIDDEENGAISSLSRSRRALAQLRGKDDSLEEDLATLDENFYAVSELSGSLSSYLEKLSADPIRLEELLTRRAALKTLVKRFGNIADPDDSLTEILDRAKQAKEKIENLSGGENRLVAMEQAHKLLRDEVAQAAQKLSNARHRISKALNAEVTRELHQLAMPKAIFECRVNSLPTDENLADEQFTASGIDEIEMVFTSHSNGELLPISKAASGGELSRLMLAIEVVVAESSPKGTYLFDEIDAGIGGKAALEVGKRLKKLAEHAQIIVVTHLPQVAIWGDHHLRVMKDETGSISESSINIVTGAERESEIARMLSGLEESEHAQEHARELLDLVKR